MRIPRSGIAAAVTTILLAGGAFAAPALAGTPKPADNPDVLIAAKTISHGTSRPKGAPHSGDTFWLSESLKFAGKRIGTSFVSCTYVDGVNQIAECNITWDFSIIGIGTIQGAGTEDTSDGADDSTVAITGGTDDEEGLSGQVGISLDSSTRTTYDFLIIGPANLP